MMCFTKRKIVSILLLISLSFFTKVRSEENNIYRKVGPLGTGLIYQSTSLHDKGKYSDHILAYLYHSVDGGNNWLPLFSHFSQHDWVTAPLAQEMICDGSDPHIIYMTIPFSGQGPFARSLDNGETWEFEGNQFGENKRGMFVVQDISGKLFLLAYKTDGGGGALFRSVDKGKTWVKIEIEKGGKFFLSSMMEIYSFWADPAMPDCLYAMYESMGSSPRGAAFLVSEDGGKNWKRRETGLQHKNNGFLARKYGFTAIAQAAVPPYTIYGFGNWGEKIDGVCHGALSKDRGKHWQTFDAKGGIFYQLLNVKVKPGTNNVLWAYTYGKDSKGKAVGPGFRLWESQDSGKQWNMKGKILPSEGWKWDDSLWSKYRDSDLMWITKEGRIVINKYPLGFIISDDNGETFTVHNSGVKEWPFNELLKLSDGTIYAGTLRDGAWYSRDGGNNWQFVPLGSDSPGVVGPNYNLQETENHGVIGYGSSGDWLIMKYDNNLVSLYEKCSSGDSSAFVYLEEEKKFVSIFSWPYFVAKQSDENCQTITDLGTVPVTQDFGFTYLLAEPGDSAHLIAAGFDNIYHNPCTYAESSWAASRYDSVEGAILESTDGGYSWSRLEMPIGSVLRLFRDPCNPNVLAVSASGFDESGGVFVSEDGGHTWERRSDCLQGYETDAGILLSCAISPVRDGVLYAAVNLNGGIYKSENLGRTWMKIADNPVQFPNDFIRDFVCLEQSASSSNVVPLSTLCMTDILPLDDGKESLLISTLADGLFLLEKQE